ncbi:hypothetical protein, partial [Salmonella enterica]|uniref:hypothetical protein n=1 Tax=Salmonella enterica TaxID=28901 RepID=UPI0021B3D274
MIGHEPFSAAPHPHHHHDRFWRVVRLLWVLELDTSRIQPKAPPAMDGAFLLRRHPARERSNTMADALLIIDMQTGLYA